MKNGMRAVMTGLLAVTLPAMALPVSVHAATTPWCPVSPAAAKAALPSVAYLKPLLDSQPAPMVHIHTEGTLEHHGIRDESIVAKKQLPIMRDAAYAWRTGAGEAYYTLAARYLNAWVATYQPNLNPIDETDFDAMIDTFAVIQNHMDAEHKAAAHTFFTTWARGYVTAIDAQQIVGPNPQARNWTNNWQSHRLKLITMMAAALDDKALFDDARRLFRAQIAYNIDTDGQVIDFTQRDAMHYVIYDLEPLTQAALAARTRGEDWYAYQAPSGGSVAKGFAWLEPYADGTKPHEEFAHSVVAFDAQRAAAGEKGYSGPFEPQTAGGVMWLAAQFDGHYLPLAKKLKPDAPVYLTMCGE